ncbi:uncharacterized protein LOC129950519 [Eupeodes corollae]|uniref:uncharacterized protein LOC129950519 n=1 Tax=Eupeodes corollae TaxID=290404 RepID=UPI002493A980|nr:uncharacterized protein LOC129950519 [Eupeodes corollae]
MVEFPRCYFNLTSSDSSKVQLHVFVDTSETAYAAVAYFRIATENSTEVVLVCSKTKVAPLRPISIPRMELLGTVLGSRLGNSVAKAHELKIESTHYWSDSKTVLLWLLGDPKAYKQFVMFRVGEIQESTDVSSWKYVPSKQNIPDLATKWSQQPDFNPSSPWFTGPTFLNQSPDLWPSNQLPPAKDSDAELRQNNEIKQQLAVHIFEKDPIVNYRRFSKWERLFSCMAYVNRFINLVSGKRLTGTSIKQTRLNANLDEVPYLTKSELLWGQLILYHLAQSQTFSLEYRLLSDNPHFILPKSSSLRSMSPFIDEDKTIRMRGRLEKMTLVSNTSKNPIIMPKAHYITALIVDWYHRKFKHANHETVINEIFQTYHIPGLRTLFRTIRSQCQTCKVQRARPSPPEMGSLPTARLSPYTRPFSYVGVDFFGPFLVTVGRRTEKRYGVVFTCLTCRAIHVEVGHSLTMNSCVIVIRNFIARRGYPIQFFSDNGTNLKAAEKELREAYDQINFSGIQTEFTTPHTTWEFIPPGSPHMGGAWERMVRSIKTTLYQIISPDTKMTDEKLNNLLVEVESIVNSRPLTYLSLDTAEQEAHTPNHFLLGSTSGNKPPGVFEETDRYVRSSWRHSQLLADKFWKRWVAEVLPTLTRRTNWFDKTKPIEEGDVVIIIDPSPRLCWPKGVVVKAVLAKDGQVRSAIVRTASGEYHRQAAKIAVLDVRREDKGAGVAE